jgi:hypothetical protein
VLTPAEGRILLDCAREEMSPELVRRTEEALREPLRWDHLLPAAWQHGVASLLHKNLKRFEPNEYTPPGATRKLLELYHRTGYLNLRLSKQLGELLERFTDRGIKVMVLKGAFLAQAVYADLAYRPFLDLDLLVKREDLMRARDVLYEAGYGLSAELLPEGFFLKHHFCLLFARDSGGTIYVDLHWGLSDKFAGHALDMEELWSRARPVVLSGRPAYVPSPEDLLTYLCIHIDRHGYLNRAILNSGGDLLSLVLHPLSDNHLIWFTDLYETIRSYRSEIDWVAIARRIETSAGPSVATSLLLMRGLFGEVVEADLLRELRPPRATFLKRGLLGLISNELEGPAKDDSRAWRLFRTTLLAKRQGTDFRLIRLLDLWEYIFPSADEVMKRRRCKGRSSLAFFYLLTIVSASAQCATVALHIVYNYLKMKVRRLLLRPSKERAV